MAVDVTSLVWQLVEATAHKGYEIFHLVGLKKASAIVCVFYEKRQLKTVLNIDTSVREGTFVLGLGSFSMHLLVQPLIDDVTISYELVSANI